MKVAGSTQTTSEFQDTESEEQSPRLLTEEEWQRREAALLAEMRHRVRNAVATIRTVARRTAEHSDSVEDLAAHLDGRLGAFTRTQSHLMVSPAATVDLETILTDELLAHRVHAGEGVSFGGPEVRLPLRVATAVGLALHELTTNAVKFGALGIDGGKLRVEWQVTWGASWRVLNLVWREIVPGGIAAPTRQGFGTELLETMLGRDLKGVVTPDYAPRGLTCTIVLPLVDYSAREAKLAAGQDQPRLNVHRRSGV